MYKRYLKHVLDIAGAIILLPLLILIVIPIAPLIYFTDYGPVFFKQERIGYKGRRFHLIKFRSMRIDSEHRGTGVYSYANDSRVTWIGRIIRSTSIDELPQIINILKGDMSFIGPRPPLTYHPWAYSEYSNEQKRMFDVRPGITGWAQINGRKKVEWNQRIELNIWYVDHVSFILDVKITVQTVIKVLLRENNLSEKETIKKN